MATGWLLLLLLVTSSQNVDSESAAADEEISSGDGEVTSAQKGDLERILENQEKLLHSHRTLHETQQKLFKIIQTHQEILSSRTGKL